MPEFGINHLGPRRIHARALKHPFRGHDIDALGPRGKPEPTASTPQQPDLLESLELAANMLARTEACEPPVLRMPVSSNEVQEPVIRIASVGQFSAACSTASRMDSSGFGS